MTPAWGTTTVKRLFKIVSGLVAALAMSVSAMAQGLIVNEASNGPSGSKEFYEFMVVGSSASPGGAVDLHDWIIDDNNGDWEGSLPTIGISSGYLRFDAFSDPANCSSFSSMAPGSMIVVYNDADPNAGLPADDSTDSNGDGVYVLPGNSSCLTTCNGPPTTSDPSYSSCAVPATPSYSPLLLQDSGDVAQSRDASGALFHGFTYGKIKTPYPAGSFNAGKGAGFKRTYVFACGDWYNGANFSRQSAATESPGSTNNALNDLLRQKIQYGTFDYGNPANPLNCTVTSATLAGSKSVEVWDPLSSGLYAVPGSEVVYAITIENSGTGPADVDSVLLIDALPSELEFYNADIDDAGPETDPVIGTDSGTGLSLTYPADVAFFNGATKPADFSACNYAPATGYDPNVTFICLNPKGTMAMGAPANSFEIKFRARIR